MFAYCNNNPVNRIDNAGTLPQWIKDIKDWFDEKKEEIEETINNSDEEEVLDAKVFSFYKGKFVLKLPIGKNAASFGIIVIGSDLNTSNGGINTVRHEYGHTQQLEDLGFMSFLICVATPSVIGNLLDKADLLPVPYYSLPWEYAADQLGEVNGRQYTYWAESLSDVYYRCCERFSLMEYMKGES